MILAYLKLRNGNICFDAITKTKTVENLIPKVKHEPFSKILKLKQFVKLFFYRIVTFGGFA